MPDPTPHDHLVAGSTGMEEAPTPLAPAEPADGAVPERLRSNRDFIAVLLGQAISSFGDAISNTALPILVLALTGSGFAMGIVGVLSQLPDLLVGLPAGAYADRWDRRKMMMLADFGRAFLTALIPISVWFGGPTMVVILAAAFPINTLRVLWLAAWTASTPGLVGRAQVPRASAVFEAIFNLGWIAGPALAGILSALIGPGPTIAIDALSFFVSALALFLVRRPLRPEKRTEETHILADIREGIRFVAGHPTLRSVIVMWT
ncbi:MAG: MFS transporter, partial [Chloroflexota bacterium]